MRVLSVTRIAPQNLAAFQISTANATTAFGLQNALMAIGSTAAMKVSTGIQVPNLLQVTITQPSMNDQIAWPGDWILVTDATYNDTTNTWTVTSTTQVIVYGRGTGQVGTPTDFVNTFTADTAIDWPATTTAPAATADTGAQITITFPAPASADGPWTWEYTLTDHTTSTTGSPTTFTPTTDTDGNLNTTITALTSGHDYSATITITDTYSQTATSTASNTVTAAA